MVFGKLEKNKFKDFIFLISFFPAKQSENEVVKIAPVDGPSNQENENLFGIPKNYLNDPIPDQNGIHHHDPNEQNGHASFPMDQSNNNELNVIANLNF